MDNYEIYTCVTPDYDNIVNENVKYISPPDLFINPVLNAKVVKVLSHQYIKSDISIWLDGNMELRPNFDPINILQDYDMVLIIHPARTCIYKEERPAKNRIRKTIKDQYYVNQVTEQIKYYRSIDFPSDFGLWCGGFIIRRHNQKVIDFNNAWWSEICRFSYRDQLSLPVVLSRFPDLKIKTLNVRITKNNMFKKRSHN